MDGSTLSSFYIKAQNANITVINLFKDKQTILSISGTGTSTTILYVPDWQQPTTVSGATSWTYDPSTKTVTIVVNHASTATVTLSWLGAGIPVTPGYIWNPFELMNQYLKTGNLVGFVFAIYSSLIGDLIFGIIILIISIPLYLRTQSLAYVALLWLLLGSMFAFLIPIPARMTGYVFMILGVAGILYKLFIGSREE